MSGKLLGKDWQLLDNPMEEDAEALSQLLRLFYSGKRRIPKRILLPFSLPDSDDIAKLLEEERGSGVHIYTPQRGEKRVWLEAASENARAEIRRAISLLFDRNYIVNEIAQGGQVPASSFVAMGMTEPDGS